MMSAIHILYFHQKVSLQANPLMNSIVDFTQLKYEKFFILYFKAYNLKEQSISMVQVKSFHLFLCKKSLNFFYVIFFYFSCTFSGFLNKLELIFH